MAVIDLDNYTVDKSSEEPVVGRIIDLDTGKYVAASPAPQVLGTPMPEARRLLGVAASRKQEEAERNQTDKETRATKELPEITFSGLLSGEDPANSALAASSILTATNPREIGDILTNLFPHIGITEDEQGNLIANNNKTGVQAVINKPGASPLDFIQTLGIMSAFTPAASVASMPAKIIPRALVGGAGAGLTQTALEELQEQAGGVFNEDEIAIATGLGGVAEVVLPAIQSLRQSRLASQAEASGQSIDDVAGQISIGQKASTKTGIDLFPAQKTTIPSELEKQSFIAQLPAGTGRAFNALRSQNHQASQAVDDFLKQLAPDSAIVTGAEKFRTVAERSISVAKRARSEAASPIYKQAFRRQRQGKIGKIDTQELEMKITNMMKQFDPKGEISKNLNKGLLKIQNANGDLRKLHLGKMEIDQTINKFGDNSVGNTTKRFLTDVKNDLVDTLVDQSPSYRAAREEFTRLSPPVDSLVNESMIGKIAKFDDTQLKTISRKIFDPAETNPNVVRQTKKIISDINPDAWNELLRTELERRMGTIKSTLEGGTTENVPGQLFRSIFGNTKQRSVLFNAVDGETKRNLKYLETALSRASMGRPGGSQTAIREEIKHELRGGIPSAIRGFFTSPIKSSADVISTGVTGSTADAAFNARVRALADVLYDPQWVPRMKTLRKLDSNSPAAGRALFQLLDDAIETDSENL